MLLLLVITFFFSLPKVSIENTYAKEPELDNIMADPYYMLLGSDIAYDYFSSSIGESLEEVYYHKDKLDTYSRTWKIIEFDEVLLDYGIEEFSAVALEDEFNNIMIAFRGSDSLMADWSEHVASIVGGIIPINTEYGLIYRHPQSEAAYEFVKKVDQKVKEKNKEARYFITGHSLGGHLAQYATYKMNEEINIIQTTTFNSLIIVKNPTDKAKNLKVNNFIIYGEFLNTAASISGYEHLGTTEEFKAGGLLDDTFTLHGIKNFYELNDQRFVKKHPNNPQEVLSGFIFVKVNDEEKLPLYSFKTEASAKFQLFKDGNLVREDDGVSYSFNKGELGEGNLTSGNYTIKVQAEGFEDFEESIYLDAEKNTKIDINLTPKYTADYYLNLAKVYSQSKRDNDALIAINKSIELSPTKEALIERIKYTINLNKCSSASILAKEFKSQYPGSIEKYEELLSAISDKFNSKTCVVEPLTNQGTLYKLWDSPYGGTLRAIGEDNQLYFTGHTDLVASDNKVTKTLAKVDWGLSDAFSGGHYTASVALGANSRVYAGLNGKIKSYNLNLKDEKVIQIQGSPAPITIGDDGKVYVTTSSGMLYVISSDFSDIKSYKFGDHWNVTSPTVASGGAIYVGSGSKLHAIKPDLSGEEWKAIDFKNIENYTSKISTPVIGKDNIAYVAGENSLIAVSPDGTVIGTHKFPSDWDVSKPVIASDGTVYTAIKPWSTNPYIAAYSSDLKYLENRYEFERKSFWAGITEPLLDNNDNLLVTKHEDMLSSVKNNTLIYINPREHSMKSYIADSVISLPENFEKDGIFYITKKTGMEALSVGQRIDNVAPVVEGIQDVTIALNEQFDTKRNVTAIDNIDGDITNLIVIEGKVDTTKVGTYEIIYKVADKAGNVTVIKRKVTVKSGVQSIPLLVNDITNISTLVSGQAKPGTVVTMKQGNTIVGQAFVVEDGTFRISLISPRAGTEFQFIAEDNSGNVSKEVTVTVIDILGLENYFAWKPDQVVDMNKDWTIYFNHEIDEDTINSDSIYVHYNQQKVEGVKLIVSDDRKSIKVLAPLKGYESGKTYFLYIEDEVLSASGESLNKAIKLKFLVK